MALRFGMNVSSEGCCLIPCAGCVLLITFKKLLGSTTAEHLTRCFIPTVRVAQNMISQAPKEETLERLGARLHLMSDDMGDHPMMIALRPGPRARGRSPPATTIRGISIKIVPC